MDKLTWKNVNIKLGALKPWEQNPKRIGKAQAQRLLDSFKEFGQPETIAIGPEGEVYDGHQRLSVLLSAYGPDYEVAARQSSRPLTEKERKKLVVLLHSGTTGTWNWDMLSGWDVDELKQWGLDNNTLNGWKNDAEELAALLEASNLDDDYTRKIAAPIYTPKGEKPGIDQLYDDSKYRELIVEIDASSLPEDEKAFLRIAAVRHIVFNYRDIAEYYSHSEEMMQFLMENSALVIIDFDRAIELGYVRLSEKVARQYRKEHGSDEG